MTKTRASIFEETPEIDLTGFAPKANPDAKAPPADVVRAVTEKAKFRSREAKPLQPAAAPELHPVRRFRTGRNLQLNVKLDQETLNAIYAVAEANGWVLGHTLARAIAALRRELEGAS